MKWICSALGGVVIGLCLSLYFSSHSCGLWRSQSPEIKFKEVVKTEYVYIKEGLEKLPQEEGWKALKACYQSPIQIKREFIEEGVVFKTTLLREVAGDGCKETRETVRLEIGSSSGWRTYLLVGVVGSIAGGLVYHYSRR